MKNKGITLVSLVVTIIILIILAGVSLNLTLGEDGIITIAKKAKENMELAQIEEETKLNELYIQLEEEGNITGKLDYDAIARLDEFKSAIAEAITKKGVETSPDDSVDTMVENIGKIGKDETEPNIEITILGEKMQEVLPIKIEAIITNNGKPTTNAKWVLNNESEFIGTDETRYTDNLVNTNHINITIDELNTFYLHVLTENRYGIKQETIKGPIEVSKKVHHHIDASGTTQASDYQANTAGGCFNASNIVYGTKSVPRICNGKIVWQPSTNAFQCEICGMGYGGAGTCTATRYSTVQYDTGERYYTVNCGKTEELEEGYQVNF